MDNSVWCCSDTPILRARIACFLFPWQHNVAHQTTDSMWPPNIFGICLFHLSPIIKACRKNLSASVGAVILQITPYFTFKCKKSPILNHMHENSSDCYLKLKKRPGRDLNPVPVLLFSAMSGGRQPPILDRTILPGLSWPRRRLLSRRLCQINFVQM